MPYSEPYSNNRFTPLSTAYIADENELAARLAASVRPAPELRHAQEVRARHLTQGLLNDARTLSTVDAFLAEYELSSEEGVLLMRLAESLVRTPDAGTAAILLRDKIAAGNWRKHFNAKHPLVKLGTLGLCAAKGWVLLSGGRRARNVIAAIGDRLILSIARQAIALLGRHFVLGTSISHATRRAASASQYDATHSFDMLGEAAMTQADADRYFNAYAHALEHLASQSPKHQPLHQSPALSVKLSALHPRYEYAQRDRCVPALADRLLQLCEIAQSANLGLTIDAEEVDRLEVSLLVLERVMVFPQIRGWDGLGLAVQAYQKRATQTIDWVIETAKQHGQKLTVRLVKGAYWDSEIKRAQELGLASYPVFTRKEHTDISYLACAKKLLNASPLIYPQFATHNAQTAAAIIALAGERRDLEFQRLHGMSDGLHRRLSLELGFATRTYAPVGRHKELLPYLVRRLLENGANSSFVNQLQDPDANIEQLVRDPIEIAAEHGFSSHPVLASPRHRQRSARIVTGGDDLTQSAAATFVEAIAPPHVSDAIRPEASIAKAAQHCRNSSWMRKLPADRARILRGAADLFERDRLRLMTLCVFEAQKTWPDAEAELREAVDFLRYYADQAEQPAMAARLPRGTVACISPWNFPLAIFLGQVSAALSVGNCVLAKPAEQTPRIALEAVKLLREAGIPRDALHLIVGDGSVGASLVACPDIRAVCFTGSTNTAKKIAASLAASDRGDIPLIAETGGINAMFIDSTALLEQAVRDVIASAFQSAGQRCSACRLVCVQEDIADDFIKMLAGAMQLLRTDAPAALSADLGPLIDVTAHRRITNYISNCRIAFPTIGESPAPTRTDAAYIAPIAFELKSIGDLKEEIFGPVLHLVRFKRNAFLETIEQVNALGFGLTMGLHTRIDQRTEETANHARVGNLYINRNQIGAVVGEQPFGGEGLSGTGPKAGGPYYIQRLTETAAGVLPPDTSATIELPGPTGETNTLSFVPRGRLLCLGGDQASVLDAQIARVEDTGNVPVLLEFGGIDDALKDPSLKGVVADGSVRSEVAKSLAERTGAILPLLSAADAPSRFMLERVVTIDTTAAGGNASLLASI
ncbi:MAG: L-glutamate gamma-semialdehyde dehydrogenase [Pseudomonadota bacterium]